MDNPDYGAVEGGWDHSWKGVSSSRAPVNRFLLADFEKKARSGNGGQFFLSRRTSGLFFGNTA